MSSPFEVIVCPLVEDLSLLIMNPRPSLLMLSSEAGVIANGHSASKVKLTIKYHFNNRALFYHQVTAGC